MDSIFEKFTNHSRNALKNAFDLALASGHRTITPNHILYGLRQEKGSIASQILTKVKINSPEIEESLKQNSFSNKTITQIGLALNTKRILEKAFLIASLNQHKYIGTEHLLASMLIIGDPDITKVFQKKGIDYVEVQKQVDTILNSTSKFPDLADSLGASPKKNDENDYQSQQATIQPSSLDLFATNLTDFVIQKNIDPVIGRQEEIDRLIQILSRRNKNNPLLLGDPGVGKTAIVEGLAKKIIQGDVPEVLLGKKIYTLDLSLVVAGTSFRGEFENRIKQIITEIKKDPDIILFIDEIHNIIGVGSATGSMDAANILKPALARGEIRCIGATTTQDFKKQIESDPALERRFQPIFVDEATTEKTIEILKGVKENYEIFHGVKINNQAIDAAAELSQKYIADRFLPDKAIDLIDEAASEVKIKNLNNPFNKKILELENKLKAIKEKKQEAVAKEKFSVALNFRKQEKEILTELRDLKNNREKTNQKSLPEISRTDVAKIVSNITGVPLSELILEEKKRLLKLEDTLAKKIIDQDEALKSVSEFIRRSRTGITDSNRPIGSFIFLGPSGVGKTETARVLAQTVFGSHKNLIKIDMSEFAESFNISKLIGAPAGYVGYKEGTKLTDAVKHRPYSVVLFDEIEKAHSQIFNLMLQILEDGHITDGTGKIINFKNTIIIMTSNLGSEGFNQQAALGFQSKKQIESIQEWQDVQQGVMKKLKNKFPPEFLSRIDKTIVFKPLTMKAINKITKIQLGELEERLNQQGIKIEFEPKVTKIIAQEGYSPEIGARQIRKGIQEKIESQIAKKILTNKLKTRKIKVKVKDNKIII